MEWTDETIRYYTDAVRCTDYYKEIARHIAPHLPPAAHICDAGCGMGGLALALLPLCESVTAIDISRTAIRALSCAAECADGRLVPLCGDAAQLRPETPYDAMVFCLFGSMEQTLPIAAQQCRGKVFLIKRDYGFHRFSAEDIPLGEYTAEASERILRERGIPFTAERFSASFGQPFRSLEDAVRFFALYNKSETRQLTELEIRSRLTAGTSEEFPYYLPHEKKLRLITFESGDISGRR